MAFSETVEFKHQGFAVVVHGPAGESRIDQLTRFSRVISTGGTQYAYASTSVERWLWSMTLVDLDLVQHSKFAEFWKLQARGPINQFRYRHTDGQLYQQCQFHNTELRWRRTGPKTFSVPIVLLTTTQPQSNIA